MVIRDTLAKAPEGCRYSLGSLVGKAITIYENRAPDLRHGIALVREVTIILSQSDDERPLCGIYFNLHSPYQRQQEKSKKQVEVCSVHLSAGRV